ncbi:MAG: hypothetical protein DMF61_06665 [Blastocatellia bacterium AA13]|nr:MAG: hypothetical protein DMF61_06665 [Blastocatellia bacterium AA13]
MLRSSMGSSSYRRSRASSRSKSRITERDFKEQAMDKHAIIEKLLEERQNVLKAIEGISDDEMNEPMGEGKWSVKDTLGHLAAWEGEVVNAFEQKARGERPTVGDIKDYDSWNSAQAAKRKDKSVEEIREEFNETRKKLLTIVNDLPEDENLWAPERSTSKYLNDLIEHDRHHWKALCAYRHLDCADA